MPIPDFTEFGDLPQGIHPATLKEVLSRFNDGDTQRVAVSKRLERIYYLATTTRHLSRFVIFGSYVTDKPDPNDVDLFLIMDDDFDVNSLQGEQTLLFDHSAADSHFGASIFWMRRLAALGGEQAVIEYWQTKRGGGQRGIIELVENLP